ncbi:MAG: hypothetical protein IFK93_05830 [Acidobacteria bacterium]|nr:hypothetical protein [Candidatus Sulfomarinibacter kjeldsenii]
MRSAEVGQIGGGAAGFEEFTRALEVFFLAAQHQRPLQLDPAAEVFEGGDWTELRSG